MRGIHIVPDIEEEASGPTYSVVRLCEDLIKKNNYTVLVTLGERKGRYKFHKTFPRFYYFYRLGVSPKMKFEIDRMVKEKSIEYIHSHGLWMMPNIYAGWIAKKHKIPLIVSPRGALSKNAMKTGLILVKTAFWMLFQKRVLLSSACFHATSIGECKDIRRMGFKQPISVIPNGIDFQKNNKKTDKYSKTLLFLGRIHPIKGIENLLHAWVEVQDQFPNWKLKIVGPGDKKYTEKVKHLSNYIKAERVDFLGAVYGENKWDIYRAADLYILPSFSENFGMTVAESLSVGTPVITTKGTPWSGLIDKNAGFWVDHDTTSLKLCLLKALRLSKDELYIMGLNGLHWMQEDFSWDVVSMQMSETYKWILSNDNVTPSFISLD